MALRRAGVAVLTVREAQPGRGQTDNRMPSRSFRVIPAASGRPALATLGRPGANDVHNVLMIEVHDDPPQAAAVSAEHECRRQCQLGLIGDALGKAYRPAGVDQGVTVIKRCLAHPGQCRARGADGREHFRSHRQCCHQCGPGDRCCRTRAEVEELLLEHLLEGDDVECCACLLEAFRRTDRHQVEHSSRQAGHSVATQRARRRCCVSDVVSPMLCLRCCVSDVVSPTLCLRAPPHPGRHIAQRGWFGPGPEAGDSHENSGRDGIRPPEKRLHGK